MGFTSCWPSVSSGQKEIFGHHMGKSHCPCVPSCHQQCSLGCFCLPEETGAQRYRRACDMW